MKRKSFSLFLVIFYMFFTSLGGIQAVADSTDGINYISVTKKNILSPNVETVIVSMIDNSAVKSIKANYLMPNGSTTQILLYMNGEGVFEGSVPSYYSTEGSWKVTSLFVEYRNGQFKVIEDNDFGGSSELNGGNFQVLSTDTTGPVFSKVLVDKTRIETGGTVTVTVSAEDDLSGIKNISLEYLLPNNSYMSFTAASIGNNQYQYTLPSTITSGNYGVGKFELVSLTLQDYSNNATTIYDYSYYQTGNLDGGDFTTITDTAGPIFTSVSVDKAMLEPGGTVTVTVNAEDELSGVKNVSLEYLLPNNSYMTFTAQMTGKNKYQYTIPSSITSESHGTGKFELVSLTLRDNKNNSTSIYDYSYYRTGDLGGGDFTTYIDTTGPVLNKISVDKNQIEAGGTVTVTVDAVDELSSVNTITLTYKTPNKGSVTYYVQSIGNNQYQYTFSSASTAESYGIGKFELVMVDLYDSKNNNTRISDTSGTGSLDGGDFVTYTDTTGPVFNKVAVDQTKTLPNGTVTVTVDAVDDMSGISSVSLEYLQPNNSYISFTAQSVGNNQYQYTIPSSLTSEVGKFELVSLSLIDSKNNFTTIYDYSYYRTGDLGGGDFSVIPEGNAPEVTWVSVDTKEITSGDSLRVLAEVEDASGVAKVKVTFQQPNGNSYTAILSHSHDQIFEGYIPGDVTSNAVGNWTTTFVWVSDIFENSTYIWSQSSYWWGRDFSSANFYVKEKDSYPPSVPYVNNVDEHSTVVYGSAEAGSTVKATVNGVEIGSASVDLFGYFQIYILQQAASTVISVTATDASGNISSATSVIVQDVTAPAKADVYTVYDYDYYATGYAEPGSSVYVYANGYYVGEATTNVYGVFSVPVNGQPAGTLLSISVYDTSGNSSEPTYITVQDGTAPAKPEVSVVTDQSTVVTGTAEKGSVVRVLKDGGMMGSAVSNQDGTFSVGIDKQPAGTQLVVMAEDQAGNVSDSVTVIVKDATSPGKPIVNEVNDSDTLVYGQAEAESKVEISAGSTVIGSGAADLDGTFTVKIPLLKAGTKLIITATDEAGNVSTAAVVTVLDRTAPEIPVLSEEISDQSTIVRGQAEPYTTIDVMVGDTTIGSGKTSVTGYFSVGIPKQPAGTEVFVISTDLAGNNSVKSIVVKDKTTPMKPVVSDVSDKDTVVAGKAEAGSKVVVNVDDSVLGEATVGIDGKFTVEIPVLKAGTELSVTATDKAGNVSEVTIVVVLDRTAPESPILYEEVTNQSDRINGQAEAGASVEVKVDGKVIGSGAADFDGVFTVKIPVLKTGTKLSITATDEAGNVSDALITVVQDRTSPVIPVLDEEVTDLSTVVIGKAEPDTLIDVVVGETTIGTGAADVDGNFSVAIPKQAAGTEVFVISTDATGNNSVKAVIVKDKTAPVKPVVNNVTDKDTSLTGKEEAGTIVEVHVDGTLIGKGTASEDGQFKVTIPVQKAGTELVIVATDKAGNVSESTTVVVKDVTAPSKPVVNEVTDKDTKVTGEGEAGSSVEVKVKDLVLGKGTVGEDGKFNVTIPLQRAGTELVVIVTDQAGNLSEATTVEVKDVTAPALPSVSEVTDKDTSVTGQAEAGSKVEVKVNRAVIGTGTVGEGGQYKVTISAQKAGTELVIIATDKAGNVSEATTVMVKDVTAPVKPEVNEVTDKDTTVTGQAEAGSKVEVKVSGLVIGTGTSGEDGQYKVTISAAQKAGTELVIVATDKAGNVSETTKVVVKDVTAPVKPEVNEVTDKDTAVTGKAEAGSKVEVKVNGSVIGSGTAGEEDGQYKVTIPTQKAGTELVISVTDKAENVSETTTVVVKDVTAPVKPEVNEVTDKDTTVTGKAEAGSKIEVKVNDSVIGTGAAGEDGQYQVTIPTQKAGTELVISATDKAGNVSETTTVVVKDVTSPVKPVVNEVTDKDTTVTGKAEAGSKVEVKVNGSVIGTETAGEDGQYKVTIPTQKAETELVIIATDNAGNVSETTTVIVKDVTVPTKPEVNEVTDKDTSVSGQAEAGSKVEVKVNGSLSGTGTAEEDGQYLVSIPTQKAGTELVISATDKAGNVSETTTVVVKDVTAPVKPEVNEVTDKDTTVTGKAEAGSKVEVKVNGSVIGTETAEEDGQYKVTIPTQKAGTELVICATDKEGNVSETTTVVVKDVTAPVKPEVNEVTDKDTSVTGKAEAGSKVEVKVNGSVIGSGTAGEDGQYKVTIPTQKAGTELVIIATDKSGNVSETTIVVVKDVTAPVKPEINEVTDKDTTVTGKAEPGSKVEVKVNDSVIGNGTAGEDGQYKVTIPTQKAGTELVISATDKAGNVSETTIVVVKDVTAPVKPEVNEVTDKDITVTGKAEAGSIVEVKVNGSVIGTGTTEEDGHYEVTIPVQQAGIELSIIATDKAGNVSEATIVIVKDVTAPGKPLVNQVSDKDTTVTGQAEVGSKIEVKVSGSVIGTGTGGEGGQYKVSIRVQKVGTVLEIIAIDSDGNQSEGTTIKVIDKTAPTVLTVNTVSDKSKEVTGKTEAGATVSILIGTKIYATKADTTGNFKVIILAQKAGSKLTVTAKDAAGNVSAAKSITVLDKTAPVTPSVTTISDQAKVVTGKAEAGAIVTVTIGTKKYIAKADSKGNFKVTIPVQKAGTKVTVTAKDTAGNVSVAKSVIVIDKTAPLAPKIKTVVKSTTKEVTGTSETYSTITIKVGSKVIGTAKADSKGNFKVKIKAQKKNTILSVTATDKAKNVSKAATVKVK
ncbi:Ig-like domain-containing protein [Neobacillus sp. SuZ13]|uniref:Ig-like domain-containing protein n=1 Tax=Neobacillus sp. SuZ13 TaxID=3047875 RepID=UPI0024BF20D0|nr:Ig-like domain-containing protein [Neobacillus sp. SuZ13]WHY66779.1 Ig-like domain-containing protein [Neobacillus sp. SuZ13]